MLAEGTDQFVRQLRTVAPDVVVLYEDNFNFLSKMCLDKMRGAACRMITASRRYGARVVVAGSDATDAPQVYLGAGAEIVLIGEGLTTLATLCERLAQRPSLPTADLVAGLTGLVFERGVTAADAQRPLVRSNAPHPQVPALDLIDVEKYRTIWQRAHGYFSLNMSASRGCSFRCNWCSKPIWGNQYLQRPALEVAAEMAHLKHQFAPDHVWFADDIFGFRADWVETFGAALASSGGGVPFTIQIRPDLISVRMARALRQAGCREAWLGAESGSQRILDEMDKGTTVAEILLARERLREENIKVGFFIQLGYLGERLEDILATRRLVEMARPDDVGVSVSYPLPGTKFYERVKAQLGTKTHWQESDDLAMMFKGTYSTEFYRLVRDLLHAQIDAEQQSNRADSRAGGTLAVAERWERLLANELAYRLENAGQAAAGTSAGSTLAAGMA
jgi:anaerobic magnesium-protoporphyrin IX monomethyl ester cyclase